MNWRVKRFEHALLHICSECDVRCGDGEVIGYAFKHAGTSSVSDSVHHYDDLVMPKKQEEIGVYIEFQIPETRRDVRGEYKHVYDFVLCLTGPIDDWLDFTVRLRQNGNLSDAKTFIELAENWAKSRGDDVKATQIHPK